jgi:hypothetical protein
MSLTESAKSSQFISSLHAARALELAHCQHHSGTADALAWAAAGMPDDGVGPDEREVYQQARLIVHQNNGTFGPADVGILVRRINRRREARQ